MNAPVLTSQATYEAQANFVAELATRLHVYGTTAQRLEAAVEAVAHRLGLDCEIFSNPTGMILSFADPVRGQHNGITRVIRLDPGEQNLARLAATDAIADDVLAGRLAPADGLAALKALDRPGTRRMQALAAFSFGLSAAAVAALLGAGL
ncbi:MAG: threonine/serine exporter family protein, partial [Arenimonas sp.]|nr:threonine/serine exporter family protein [Arenimonas sp.]